MIEEHGLRNGAATGKTPGTSPYSIGAPVQVTRATLVPGYIGFYLIELQLPLIVNAGKSELYIAADNHESNRVQVVIEP